MSFLYSTNGLQNISTKRFTYKVGVHKKLIFTEFLNWDRLNVFQDKNVWCSNNYSTWDFFKIFPHPPTKLCLFFFTYMFPPKFVSKNNVCMVTLVLLTCWTSTIDSLMAPYLPTYLIGHNDSGPNLQIITGRLEIRSVTKLRWMVTPKKNCQVVGIPSTKGALATEIFFKGKKQIFSQRVFF